LASFEDACRLLRSRDTMANIEIKPTPGFDVATGRRVAALAQEYFRGAPVPPLFSSFSFEALMAAREAAPAIPRGWLVSEFTDADWDRLAALEAVSLHTNHRHLDARNVGRLHERG